MISSLCSYCHGSGRQLVKGARFFCMVCNGTGFLKSLCDDCEGELTGG